jgi:hypothetical protein
MAGTAPPHPDIAGLENRPSQDDGHFVKGLVSVTALPPRSQKGTAASRVGFGTAAKASIRWIEELVLS